MKRNTIPKPALACLVIGLLITTLTPMVARYCPLPDSLRGFLTGLGLTLEFIALIKIQRSSKRNKCAATNIEVPVK